MRSVRLKIQLKSPPSKQLSKKILLRLCLYEHFKEGNYKISIFCISVINGLSIKCARRAISLLQMSFRKIFLRIKVT